MKEYYRRKLYMLDEGYAVPGFTPGYWHRFPEETPEEDRLLYVIDAEKVKVNESAVNDAYKKMSRHPVMQPFTIGDIECAYGEGWLKNPSGPNEVAAALAFKMPEKARGKISGYVGDETVQIFVSNIFRKHLKPGFEYRALYASNTGNLGFACVVNGRRVVFYKQPYDFRAGLLANLVRVADNAIDAYKGKDFGWEMVQELKRRGVNEEAIPGFTPGYWHRFPDETPEADRLLYVIDNTGRRQGHLSTKVVWDGRRFRSTLAHRLMVDTDNIVGWRYLDEN